MTQDDIIKMAKQAKLPDYWDTGDIQCLEEVKSFAKLVAAHVSRELAKECAGSGEWNAVHIIEAIRW